MGRHQVPGPDNPDEERDGVAAVATAAAAASTTARASASGVSRRRQLEHVAQAEHVVVCEAAPPSDEGVDRLPWFDLAVVHHPVRTPVGGADEGQCLAIGHARE